MLCRGGARARIFRGVAEGGMSGRGVLLLAAIAVTTGGGPAGQRPVGAQQAARFRVEALAEAGQRSIEAAAYPAAEAQLRAALALAESRLGEGDLDTARVLNALGMLGKYTARFDEARRLYLRALSIAERAGGDPLLEADVYHNLGGLEHARGAFAAGEPYARRAVAIRTGILGPDHSAVAADEAALAALVDAQGRYDEAEALYVKAIGVFQREPGPPPLELAVSLNNLAAIEQARGRLRRAEGLYRRALALKERRWGGGHPDVAVTLNNLAVLCRKQGRRAEAARLYERALAIFTRALGADHPQARACRANYERLLAEGRPEKRRMG